MNKHDVNIIIEILEMTMIHCVKKNIKLINLLLQNIKKNGDFYLSFTIIKISCLIKILQYYSNNIVDTYHPNINLVQNSIKRSVLILQYEIDKREKLILEYYKYIQKYAKKEILIK
jgi:hypothetical protein